MVDDCLDEKRYADKMLQYTKSVWVSQSCGCQGQVGEKQQATEAAQEWELWKLDVLEEGV